MSVGQKDYGRRVNVEGFSFSKGISATVFVPIPILPILKDKMKQLDVVVSPCAFLIPILVLAYA